MILILVPKFGLLVSNLCGWLLLSILLLLLVPHLHLHILYPLLVLQFDLLGVNTGASHSRHLAKAHQKAHEDAHEQNQETKYPSAHTISVSREFIRLLIFTSQ